MAKGINLTDTRIIKFTILVHPDRSDALVRVRYEILDDDDEVVRTQFIEQQFSDMATQEKANLNNFLRLKSKTINEDIVEENSSTWVDI